MHERAGASRRAVVVAFLGMFGIGAFKGPAFTPVEPDTRKDGRHPETRGLTGRPASCFASWAAKGRCGRAFRPGLMRTNIGAIPT